MRRLQIGGYGTWSGAPVVANGLWDESPLYENEGLKVGRNSTVTPIE